MGERVRQRNAAKERFWRQTITEQRRSGLSIRAFCSRRSVSEPQFYAWRRELAQRDARAGKAMPAADQAQATPRFVSLQLAAQPPAMIEVVTRGGHTLRVPPGVDRQTLADVWALLEARPC